MSLPTSRGAYLEYYEIWERALADPSGIRIRMPDYDACMYHRSRLNFARTILKNESRELYEPGHPQYNISPFDGLMALIRRQGPDDAFYLLLVPRTFGIVGEIESLTGTEFEPRWKSLPAAEPAPLLQLTSPSGSRLLETRSGSISDAPSDASSSKPSTTPEPSTDDLPETDGLRRL